MDPDEHRLQTAIDDFRRREIQALRGNARMLMRDALLTTRRSLASDPRDKIYALLSITTDGTDVMLVPNYMQSVHEGCTEVGRHIIST